MINLCSLYFVDYVREHSGMSFKESLIKNNIIFYLLRGVTNIYLFIYLLSFRVMLIP